MIRILLVDDHPVVRQGLRQILESDPAFTVVGEAADGLAALELVAALHPDVVILDLALPSLNGIEVARRIAKDRKTIRTLILSMHNNEAYVLEAFREGILGYVLKESATKDLVLAVKEVAAGRRYLSPPLSERSLQKFADRISSSSLDPYDTLTDREREILHLLADGLGRSQIAHRLKISARTFDTHRTNLMRKLNFDNPADLIKFALQHSIDHQPE
ncbi:MAG: response regulator transcription factor [Anaerolineae bacterium]|nr:response regulator transcription factor [Anaerolineae bacterium]